MASHNQSHGGLVLMFNVLRCRADILGTTSWRRKGYKQGLIDDYYFFGEDENLSAIASQTNNGSIR